MVEKKIAFDLRVTGVTSFDDDESDLETVIVCMEEDLRDACWDVEVTPIEKELSELAKAKAEGRLIEVVRCKDCSYRVPGENSYGEIWCRKVKWLKEPLNYCMYGKTREL